VQRGATYSPLYHWFQCGLQRLIAKKGRQRLVGILMANAEGDPEGKARIVTFREALRGAGWRDTDISIEVRWHGGSAERANALAKELADLSPDVLVGNGTQAVSALKATTSTIPIVFVVVHDPVAAGFVRISRGRAATSRGSALSSLPSPGSGLKSSLRQRRRSDVLAFSPTLTCAPSEIFGVQLRLPLPPSGSIP
jgi:hypothetical protein